MGVVEEVLEEVVAEDTVVGRSVDVTVDCPLCSCRFFPRFEVKVIELFMLCF